MPQDEKNECKKVGCPGYFNHNCWLAKTLKASPSKRCQYCHLKFRHCLFFQYSAITLALVSFLIAASFVMEGRISNLVILCIFVLVIVYGYFFNQSTEKIVGANFAERKAKEALEELTEKLQDKVNDQTRSLKTKNLHLQKLLKMRSEFLDIASHQLRTPVSVIKGTMEMMDDGDFDNLQVEEKKKYIKNAYEKSQKLLKIISDILMTSELDTASFEVDKKTAHSVDIAELIDKAINDVKFEADAKKIIIDWQRPTEQLPIVFGYEQYLHHAILNLLDNAIKYTPSTGATNETRDKRAEFGKIIISAILKNKNIVIQVKDNGIGIPPKEIKNLFKKFNRASNARNMYTDGSGLGLFIIKEIVRGHHGKVSVESEQGKGTTFTITLPVKTTIIS